jgi:hypothetical protein
MTDLYVLLQEFTIFPKDKTENLRKRIEYMTEFKTLTSVHFLNEPIFRENRFILTEYLCQPSMTDRKREFNYRDMVFTIENSYECSEEYFIGITSRPIGEDFTLTVDQSIKARANRKTETKHKANVNITIHYGLNDSIVLETMHHKRAFINGIEKETSPIPEFPPEMGLGLCTRSWYGGIYKYQKNNMMAFALIDVEFL